jgi:hypothetical protein
LRNRAICDLRKKNKDFWSYGMLGKLFEINKKTVERAYKRDEKEFE